MKNGKKKAMKIGVLSLAAGAHDKAALARVTEPILTQLKESFNIVKISKKRIDQVDLPLVFIKTGGTEGQFKELVPLLRRAGKPITFLAVNRFNSFPAALEILAWAKREGLPGTLLLYGDMERIKEQLGLRLRNIRAADQLYGARIGMLGRPSDWLIASGIDYEAVCRRWGVTLIDIPLQEVLANIESFSGENVLEAMLDFPTARCTGPVQPEDIVEAVRIYLGIKKTLADYQLTAFSAQCFEFLEKLKSSGCLAVSRLNDEGFSAGCEGDLPALFTMMINRLISGKTAFMGNLAGIEGEYLTLAHCSVPMSMVKSFDFDTHFESGIGVAIAGYFKREHATLSRIGGPNLDRFYVDEGNIAHDKTPYEACCRTRLNIHMNKGTGYFLANPLGNHHVISLGHFSQRFREIMEYFGAKEVGSKE